MNPYTAQETLTAFKNLCHSRGYTRKVVGDWRYEQPRKGRIGESCKLWGTKEHGAIMNVWDTKIKERECIPTELWL